MINVELYLYKSEVLGNVCMIRPIWAIPLPLVSERNLFSLDLEGFFKASDKLLDQNGLGNISCWKVISWI